MKTKNVILGLCLAVVGLLMAAMPSACIKAVVVIVGLVAICHGGYNLFVDYKFIEPTPNRFNFWQLRHNTFIVSSS